MTGLVLTSLPRNLNEDVQYAIYKCESLGLGRHLIHHGKPSALAGDFSPHVAVLRRHFLPNVHFQCCMLFQGTFGHDFVISTASGESTAWVLLWKTRSRPFGVRVCLVDHFTFFSGQVVFWKEDSGRQAQLITPENEGRDETKSPSPPRLTFFDDPDVPLGPPPLGPPDQHGLSPGWPRSSSTCWWERERLSRLCIV